MLNNLKTATEEAKNNFKESSCSIQVKSLIKQLSLEIERTANKADWDFALRLAFYRHEFAKTYGNFDWYPPYLELRKVRDHILILIEG